MADPRARRPAGRWLTRGEIRWQRVSAGAHPRPNRKASLAYARIIAMTKTDPKPRPTVIASRKTCDAEGTGLSHYVLMDKQVKR
ncbi:hypothetical protein amb1794 [Paramagnetospirillum magneticum AMB-1]|uniref:Uncharacterized protein n=1 Tax=Paramagnetospirillum magneticum (strain ATCC 700264 / AMB-1) TaxID=342108 RepID=Q2W6C7_PARM1|nr:hypothetical protein amb1794 [Paramagnetospirillum magneticum AMB-1]